MQERRKYRRADEDFYILCKTFRKVELDAQVFKILDISQGGLSFLGRDLHTKDDLLQIVLRIPPDFKEKIELFGRVINSQEDKGQYFKTHVAFIDIPFSTKTILTRIIEETSSRKTPKQS